MFSIAVITAYSLIVMSYPYIPFFIIQQLDNLFTVEGNRTGVARSDINKQSFCPSVGGQESAGIPLVKIGNMILAVRLQRMEQVDNMVFIVVFV